MGAQVPAVVQDPIPDHWIPEADDERSSSTLLLSLPGSVVELDVLVDVDGAVHCQEDVAKTRLVFLLLVSRSVSTWFRELMDQQVFFAVLAFSKFSEDVVFGGLSVLQSSYIRLDTAVVSF